MPTDNSFRPYDLDLLGTGKFNLQPGSTVATQSNALARRTLAGIPAREGRVNNGQGSGTRAPFSSGQVVPAWPAAPVQRPTVSKGWTTVETTFEAKFGPVKCKLTRRHVQDTVKVTDLNRGIQIEVTGKRVDEVIELMRHLYGA